MPIKHVEIFKSGVNAVASASASVLTGPLKVHDYATLSIMVINSQTVTLTLDLKCSFDAARAVEADIPTDILTNTSVDVSAGNTYVTSIKGPVPFSYITILGSATATISASMYNIALTGKVVQ